MKKHITITFWKSIVMCFELKYKEKYLYTYSITKKMVCQIPYIFLLFLGFYRACNEYYYLGHMDLKLD